MRTTGFFCVLPRYQMLLYIESPLKRKGYDISLVMLEETEKGTAKREDRVRIEILTISENHEDLGDDA